MPPFDPRQPFDPTGGYAPCLLGDIAPLLAPWQSAAIEILVFHGLHGYYPSRSDVVRLVAARLGDAISPSTARRALRRVVRDARRRRAVRSDAPPQEICQQGVTSDPLLAEKPLRCSNIVR